MALSDVYLITTKNLNAFLNSILAAQAPPLFTQKFLESLEFKSTNDRLLIRLFKSLGFLESSGKPTQLYFDYLDQSQSKLVLAKALREAYSDLFQVDKNAHKLTQDQVKNKFKTLTQGRKSDQVYNLMANTFVALASQADFDSTFEAEKPEETEETAPTPPQNERSLKNADNSAKIIPPVNHGTNFHYNIQIHLPDSRDAAVFDAIFQSLKKHLY